MQGARRWQQGDRVPVLIVLGLIALGLLTWGLLMLLPSFGIGGN